MIAIETLGVMGDKAFLLAFLCDLGKRINKQGTMYNRYNARNV